MNPTSEDIKDLLEDSSGVAGLVFGTNLFVGTMPTTPDSCVGLYDTGGPPPDEMISGLFYPTFQVRVRGAVGGYKTAYELAQSIRDNLHQRTGEAINGVTYVHIFATTDVLYIGKDENDRPLFSVNFRTTKEG